MTASNVVSPQEVKKLRIVRIVRIAFFLAAVACLLAAISLPVSRWETEVALWLPEKHEIVNEINGTTVTLTQCPWAWRGYPYVGFEEFQAAFARGPVEVCIDADEVSYRAPHRGNTFISSVSFSPRFGYSERLFKDGKFILVGPAKYWSWVFFAYFLAFMAITALVPWFLAEKTEKK